MQVLELIFAKEDGKTVVFSIEKPITPVDAQVVNQVMDTILTSSVFSSINDTTRKKGARLVERNVSKVPINI
ncbi:potassium channel protein [Bacillus cereus]|nr:potassium channel protein [Bacillus cereus]PFS84530.1 potassium channel protein [Bacillus cereus]